MECWRVWDSRTSAARAAADLASFSPAVGLEPSVLPPDGVGVYDGFFGGGAESFVLTGRGAGALLSERPSP